MPFEVDVEGVGIIELDGDEPTPAQIEGLRKLQRGAQVRAGTTGGVSSTAGAPAPPSPAPPAAYEPQEGAPLRLPAVRAAMALTPSERDMRMLPVAAGGAIGTAVGAASPIPGGAYMGAGLGAAAGSLAADVAGLDPSGSTMEGVTRAAWEGALEGGSGPVLGAVGRGIRAGGSMVAGVSQPALEQARRFGLRVGLENVTDSRLLKGAREIIGRIPGVSFPFNRASRRVAGDVADALDRELAGLGPGARLSPDQTGRMSFALGTRNYDRAIARAGANYSNAAQLAEAADVRIPTDRVRDTITSLQAARGERRVPVTRFVETPSQPLQRTERDASRLIDDPARSGAAAYNPPPTTIEARVTTHQRTRENPMDRFARRWAGLGDEGGNLTAAQHKAFVREIDDVIRTSKAAKNYDAVRELSQLRDAAMDDFYAMDGPREVVDAALAARQSYQAARRLTENPVAKLFERVDKRAFRPGFEEAGSVNPEQFAEKLFADGSPVLASRQGVQQLRALVGDRGFRLAYGNHLDRVIRDAVQIGRDAADNVNGDLAVADAIARKLGLDGGPTLRRQATEEALRGTGVTVQRLEDFLGAVRRAATAEPQDPSKMLSRRAALNPQTLVGGGAMGIATVVAPHGTLGAALGMLAGGGFLTSPRALSLVTRALDPSIQPSRRLELLTRAARFAAVGTVNAEPQAIPREP